MSTHGVDDLAPGWEHADCRERAAIDDRAPVDEDREFAEPAANHLNVNL